MSSRHRLSRVADFFFFPSFNSSTFEYVRYAPLFSVGRCRTFGPHQSPIRFKALGEISMESFFPPLATSLPQKTVGTTPCPRLTDHRSYGSPFPASNPNVAHGVGVPSDQIISELSSFRDGRAAN